MRVLVVEDEAVVARRLRRLIGEILGSDLERLDVIDHLGDAIDRVFETPYDLVFLDLSLHGDDGFDLLRHAVSGAFHTIVVSAHTDRALEAFELGVLDFVPKPFGRDRLARAIGRARGQGPSPRRLRQLAVRRAGQLTLVPIEQLVYVRAADDYAELHTADGRVLLHDKTLAKLEALLPEPFERVHRSYLVDLRRARRLESEPGSRYRLVLADGTDIPVGRTRVAALRKRLV
ncbi:MAG: LytTR family DNA-binding domain-containing protein [Acidobacteriota bacterium]